MSHCHAQEGNDLTCLGPVRFIGKDLLFFLTGIWGIPKASAQQDRCVNHEGAQHALSSVTNGPIPSAGRLGIRSAESGEYGSASLVLSA